MAIEEEDRSFKFVPPAARARNFRDLRGKKLKRPDALDESIMDNFPHPWIKYLKGGILPNLALPIEALHICAVHLERVGFVHDDAKRVIKYVDPPAGPNISINPYKWISIDADEEAVTAEVRQATAPVDLPNLSGKSPEELKAYEMAVRAARIHALRIANADPDAKNAITGEPTKIDSTKMIDRETGIAIDYVSQPENEILP